MLIFNTIERLERIHKLIQRKATGTPEEFAEKLHLGKRQMYNILDEFKGYGADIKYSRMRCTFYYNNDFEVIVKINVNSLSNQEQRAVYAGYDDNNSFNAMSLHKLPVTLHLCNENNLLINNFKK